MTSGHIGFALTDQLYLLSPRALTRISTLHCGPAHTGEVRLQPNLTQTQLSFSTSASARCGVGAQREVGWLHLVPAVDHLWSALFAVLWFWGLENNRVKYEPDLCTYSQGWSGKISGTSRLLILVLRKQWLRVGGEIGFWLSSSHRMKKNSRDFFCVCVWFPSHQHWNTTSECI